MYKMTHFVTLNYPQHSLLELTEGTVDSAYKTFKYVKYMETRRAHRLEIHAATHTIPFILDTLRASPFVEELKILIWDNTIEDVFIFELFEIVKKLKCLKKLRIHFGFAFKNVEMFEFFVENFKHILVEYVIDNYSAFLDSRQFFEGLSKLTKLTTLTISNSSRDFKWLKKIAKALPQLSKLYLIKLYNSDILNKGITHFLELWPEIRYIFISDRDLNNRYNLGFFKPYIRAIYKQEPLVYPIYNTQSWGNELIYSKEYNFLFLSRADNCNGVLPSNIEHLFFVNHPFNTRTGVIELKNILMRSPNIRSLRTNGSYVNSCFQIMLAKALSFQTKIFLLGDLTSDWLYHGGNLRTNSERILQFFQYGPRRQQLIK